MAQFFDVHPDDPQPRSIGQVVNLIREGGLVAYPTSSGYALGCQIGNKAGLERIRTIRRLDDRHHFTLLVSEFAQLGQFVQMGNDVFRAIKAATPGEYTFILKPTREAPKMMLQPRRKTVGIRVACNPVPRAILDELGEPLMTSTLILPGQTEPMTEGWTVFDELGHDLDAVVDSGECGTTPTTVVDFTGEEIEVLRVGGGDPSPFV